MREETDQKKIIGILGGIGSGKSTVAQLFADRGCALFDADRSAKKMLADEDIKERIRESFGGNVFNDKGLIDNQKLAEFAFSTPENIAVLNNIIHPGVLAEAETFIQSCKSELNVSFIVLDVPLLLETGWEKHCDFLVFVECDEDKRLERSAKKRGLKKNNVKKREKFQISLDKKAQIADYTISNNSDLSALAEQVDKIFTSIKK